MVASLNEGKPPSTAELQNYIRDEVALTFKTVDGSNYSGKLRWFDDHAFALALDDGGSFTLLRRNVVGYGTLGD
jgi:hypothetical protein